MEKLPFVSIIIVNWNGKEFLKDCINSLKKIDYPRKRYEIIVVDNGSTDGSVEFIRKNYKKVRIIRLRKNYGFAKGNNIGTKFARGEYIVFLNNDTKVTKNWLKNLVKAVRKNDRIAACTSKIIYFNERNLINSVGGFWSIFGLATSIGEFEEASKFNRPFPVFYPSGCSMIIRKDVFSKVGGFDGDYFCLAEDADLGWRLLNHGYKIMYQPTSIVYHKASATYKKFRTYKTWTFYFYTRNALITIFKNARKRDLIWMIPLFLLAICCECLLFLLLGRRDSSKAIVNGLKDFFLQEWQKTLKKRKKTKKTGYANLMILKLESIPQLLKRIKKFS